MLSSPHASSSVSSDFVSVSAASGLLGLDIIPGRTWLVTLPVSVKVIAIRALHFCMEPLSLLPLVVAGQLERWFVRCWLASRCGCGSHCSTTNRYLSRSARCASQVHFFPVLDRRCVAPHTLPAPAIIATCACLSALSSTPYSWCDARACYICSRPQHPMQIRSNFQIIFLFMDLGAIGAVVIAAVLFLAFVSAVFRQYPPPFCPPGMQVQLHLHFSFGMTIAPLPPPFRFSSEYAALHPKSATSARLRTDIEFVRRCVCSVTVWPVPCSL